MKRVIIARHFAREEVMGEPRWFGPPRAGSGEVNGACAVEQHGAMAVGTVDVLNCPLDPLDGAVRKLQDDAGALAGGEFGQRIERGVHFRRPAGGGALVDKAPGARRAVDRFAKTRLEVCVILVKGCGGHFQLAKQGQIPLSEIHDHRDQLVDALRVQMIANL